MNVYFKITPKLILCVFILLCVQNINAQKKGYNITFDIKNCTEKELLIAYHYGDKQYISDTLTAIKPGVFQAKNEEVLKQGMYVAYFPSKKSSFEFLVNKDEQHFQLQTVFDDLVPSMQVKGSAENTRFFNYINFLNTQGKSKKNINKKIEDLKKNATENKNKIEALEAKQTKINSTVKAYQKKIIDNNPNSFTAKIIKINNPIDIPKSIKDDHSKSFYYFRDRFFENLFLEDERFLRTSMQQPKIDYYLSEKMTVQDPDSVIVAVDKILKRSENNDEVFKYNLIALLNKYAKSKIVCHDAIYVHIVDQYYAKSKAPWTEKYQLKKILDNADVLRPILCGKKAPNLTMQTLNDANVKKSLHNIESKYTILYFWDPDCKNCEEDMPDLVKFHNNYKSKGVEIFAVCTKTYKELSKCKSFVHENDLYNWINVVDPYYRTKYTRIYDIKTTPKVFVLDQNKEIISKKNSVNQLPNLMSQLIRLEKK